MRTNRETQRWAGLEKREGGREREKGEKKGGSVWVLSLCGLNNKTGALEYLRDWVSPSVL